MNKKILTLSIILISISCLSCAFANDLNITPVDSTSNHDLEAINGTSEILSLQDDAEDNLTSGKSSSDEDSSTYLVLDNDADKEEIHIGDRVTWIIEVYNSGPNDAKNVKIFDQLPDGLTYINHKATQGTFDPKTGIWNIGNLAKNAHAFLDIITEAITSGEKVNKANLTSDTINLNNESYEEEGIDVFELNAHEKGGELEEHHSNFSSTLKSTGNPLIVLMMAIVCCLVFARKIHR